QQLALKAASIIGRVFQFEHLRSYYPALGTAEKVKADLQATEQLDLTPVESIEPELIYLFKHLVTHEVSYESIAYSARAKLHGQYAQYLENAYTDNTDKVAAQLAYHYEKAEIKEKARSYLIKAGEQAASNYANEDALSYFNRALKLTPDARSRNHFDILMKRERVYDLLGRRSEQRQDLELLEQSVSNFDDAVSLRSQIANRRAKLEIDEGDYAAANLIAGATAKELTNAVQKQADLSELLVDTLLIEARTMFLLGKASAASPQLESALSLAREHQYIRGEYNALAQLALLNWHNGDNTTAVELMEHSIELIRKAGDIRRESEILNNLGIVTKDMYRFDDALAYYERAQKITRKIGDRSGEASLLNNMGRASFASGKLAHAIEYCTQAETLAIETNDLAVRALALHNKSEAFRELGQYVSAKKAAEESIKYLKSAGYQVGEAYALENLAMTEFSLGEHVNALEHAEQALQITQAIEARRVEVSILTRLGLMHLGLNQLDLAEEALLSAQKIEGEFNEATPVFEIQAGLSNVALARGDSETIQKAQATIQNLADELLKEPVTDLAHVLPLWMYETCIRAMKAGDDMGVEKMIKRANEELHLRAKKITDEALRESFLNVGENLSIAASS
ncbi:MAG: tetratricopeptide repeat protein, partial [Anaerolineales bacterium]|nr:tetratricopeptide repeat protein [Anaerolineales bacterium]